MGGYFLFKAIAKLQLKAMTATMKQEQLQLSFFEKVVGGLGGMLMKWTQKKMLRDLESMSSLYMTITDQLKGIMRSNPALTGSLPPSQFYLLLDPSSFQQDSEFVQPSPTNPNPELWRKLTICLYVSSSLLRPTRKDAVESSAATPQFQDLFFNMLHPMAEQSISHRVDLELKVSEANDDVDLDGKSRVVVEKCVVRHAMIASEVVSLTSSLQRKIDEEYHNWPEKWEEGDGEGKGGKGGEDEYGGVIVDVEFKEKKL